MSELAYPDTSHQERWPDYVPPCENIRPLRSCRVNPTFTPPLTEESLLSLEQSQTPYRLAQRNLDRWFYYLESTFQDAFDTYRGREDKDYIPHYSEWIGKSITGSSQADFEETHHSIASSVDLFGFTVRSPLPEPQVVIPIQSHTPPVYISPYGPPPDRQTPQPSSQQLKASVSPTLSPLLSIPSRPRPETTQIQPFHQKGSPSSSPFRDFSPEPQVKLELVNTLKRRISEQAQSAQSQL
jgi:hypothetical protein